MPQTTEVTDATYKERIAKLQQAMKEFGLEAIVLESGAAMQYLTGVRWGRSERTFAVVLPAKGEPAWVLPGFEEMRARELIRIGEKDIRVWQEDESPYQRIVDALKDRGISSGRVGIDEATRFFIFDAIRKLAPTIQFSTAQAAFQSAGVNTSATGRGGRQ